MAETVRVDVPRLRSLGGQLDDIGDAARRNLSAVGGRLAVPDGPAVSGWSAHAAARGAAGGWREFLHGFAGRVSGAGRALIDAANNYQGSDDRAARRSGRYE